MAKLIKGIGLGSNFSPRFTDYLDDRRSFDTIQDMKDFAETSIADLYVTVNYEDGNFYQFNKTNSDDPTTGKWRKLESSSSGLAILEDYSKLPTANLKNGETYLCKNDYEDTSSSPSVIYSKGFYSYNLAGTKWDKIDLGGSSELSKDFTSNVEVGGVPVSTKYTAGTKLENILIDILVKYFPANLAFSISPSKTLYKIGDTVSTLDLIANVTKKSNDIASIKFYVDDVLQDTKDPSTDSGLENGGSFTYTYGTAFTTDTTLKVVVNDGKNDTTKTIKVEFVNPFYVGLASDSSLTQVLQKKGSYTYSNITCTNDAVVFKYPKSYGELKSIKDINNFENINSFTKTEEALNSIDYYVYTSGLATLSGFSYTFSF